MQTDYNFTQVFVNGMETSSAENHIVDSVHFDLKRRLFLITPQFLEKIVISDHKVCENILFVKENDGINQKDCLIFYLNVNRVYCQQIDNVAQLVIERFDNFVIFSEINKKASGFNGFCQVLLVLALLSPIVQVKLPHCFYSVSNYGENLFL